MRDKKPRPVVVTIERVPEYKGYVDGSYHVFPGGRPVVTRMRPMGFWEHLWHKIKLKVQPRPKPVKIENAPPGVGMSIAVQLSQQQYDALLGKVPQTIASFRYLQGETMSMSLVPPPRANDTETALGDCSV